ncbi:10297_t:CDS:2, partial [Gigaspora rosea]
KYEDEEYEAIVEENKMLVDGATLLKVFRHNVEKVQYSHNYDGIKKIYKDLQQEKKKETHRFWHPVTFYLFGPEGSRKTGLGQEIVLIDEFYTKIDWDNMINILNDSCFNVEKKHGEFEPFIAKYVFLTATKPLEEVYNFSQTGATEDDNKHGYEQFDRQLDYIIEFQGK